jgi:DNA replication protein DnaC
MISTEVKITQNVTCSAATENSQVRNCPACGNVLKPFISEVTARVLYPLCPCELESDRQDQERLCGRSSAAKAQKLFAGCTAGSLLAEADFSNWQQRPGAETAYRAALDYADNLAEMLRTGRGLILVGLPGCGKSHLASAIGRRASNAGYSMLFDRAPKLLMRLRTAFGSHSGNCELAMIETLGAVDLLIIDDLGAEKKTEWSEQTIYTIIDERYSNRRSTLITTNLPLEELSEKLSPRTMDRLIGSCRIIENSAASYRSGNR